MHVIIVHMRTSISSVHTHTDTYTHTHTQDEQFISDTAELELSECSQFLFVVQSWLSHHTYTHIHRDFLCREWRQWCRVKKCDIDSEREVSVCICVFLCARVCTCVCVSAALLGQLILSHLRSWVRIIKPISRQWLLQPACDWITTQPLPSAPQRERTRGEKNATPGKNEMRKEIKRDVRGSLVVGEREAEGKTETEHRIKIVFPSHIYHHHQHTQQIDSVYGPLSISLLPSAAKRILTTLHK